MEDVDRVARMIDEHFSPARAQCINYLKASGLHLALLINFREPKVEWRRIVHEL
jgi:GxxExxY protein